jgi:hypothetical protein
MIIGDNFVFIHVPRTAGTTAEDLFRSKYGLEPIYGEQHDIFANLEEHDRQKFIFGFVRNPYSQEFSNYFYHTQQSGWPHISFEEWVRLRFDDEIKELEDKYINQKIIISTNKKKYYRECFDYGSVFCNNSQYGFFCDEYGKCRASKIYRYEELGESWEDISERIGMDMRFSEISQDHPSEIYKEYYNDYTYDKITEVRKKDLELFGYTFDGYSGECSVNYSNGRIPKDYCYVKSTGMFFEL